MEGPLYQVCKKKQKYSTSVDLKLHKEFIKKLANVCYMSNLMNSNEPFDLRLPTPGCYLYHEKAGMDSDALFKVMTEHLFFTLGKLATSASPHDLYMALSYAVKDRLMTRYLASQEVIRKKPQKTVAYLSAEFLIGPQLSNNLLNLGITQEAEDALKRFGIESLSSILEVEDCLLYTSPSPRD